MGQTLEHFCVYPLCMVIQSKKEDIIRMIDMYEKDPILFDEETYGITLPHLDKLMKKCSIDSSDADVLRNFYVLIDKRGFQYASLKDVLVSFALLIASTKVECLEFAFYIHDRKQTEFVDKLVLSRILNMLNDTVYYCGDKKFPLSQVDDFVDSLYTSTGRVDGPIYYQDFYYAILQHPLMELICSRQFQGTWQDKVTDEKDIDRSHLYK